MLAAPPRGELYGAQDALTEALQRINRASARRARILIQPLEKTEGGLSEIEERGLRELATRLGAGQVVVCVGSELTDEAVKVRLGVG
jgi:rod shape-determining protein MreB